MTVRLVVVTIGMLLAGMAVGSAAQNPTLDSLMRDKLVNAQDLLEGVVRADFGRIARSADALSWVNEREIASWQSATQPAYVERATAFLLAVQGLRTAAANEDLDAAVREYTGLVSSCTGCHAYRRTVGAR